MGNWRGRGWRAAVKAGALLFGFGISLGAATAPASAASILLDQGLTTLDPNTQLEWLDLSLTQGQSYNAVAAGYGGYTTSGWRFATRTELYQLFTDAGGGGSYPETTITTGNNPTYETAFRLSLLLGATSIGSSGDILTFEGTGYLADFHVSSSGIEHFIGMFVGALMTGHVEGDLGVPLSRRADIAYSFIGSYLVRSTVATTPVPAALPLFLSGLGGLGFAAWRRRKGNADSLPRAS
jgi:hypothetical protein